MNLKRKQPPPQLGRRRQGAAERPSTPAFSYHSQRSERMLNTGRQVGRLEQPAERGVLVAVRYIVQRGGLLILLGAGALLLISSVGLSTTPRIMSLGGSNSKYFLHSTAVYQQTAGGILASSLWNRNKLTINTAGVERQLEAKFPELAHVSITLPLLSHRPIIYIEPSPPALILHAANNSFVVSDAGKAVLIASQLPADSQLSLPVVTDQTGLQARLNAQVLTHSDVRFIEIVMAELAAHHMTVSGMVLPRAASELDVNIIGRTYLIKFNMQPGYEDARQQAGTYIALENKLASDHISPASYIDVRIDGRAYYK